MTKIYCENCGSEQLEERGGTYVCKHCHAVWRKHEIDEVYDKLAAMFDEQKQERVANLRHQLYDELNADYLDSAEIIRICNEIKGYLPDDFQAKFFYIANKNSAAYLAKYMRTIAPSKHLGYVPQILDFVLRSLQEPLINATNYFIEYAYGNNRDPKMYEKYNAILQREAQKVQASVYDPTIPRHVFVAYKSEDVRKMMELVEALEAAGLSCFVALRNLQHGKGATVNYERNLRLAMDNCEVFVLVSSVKSRTIGDAREKELNYVRQKDLENCPPQYRNNDERLPIEYKKARVEYIIENYQNLAAEKTVKQFFDGFERMYSPAQVVDAVYALHDRPILSEQPAPKQEVKYCASCGTECKLSFKLCPECGSKDFVSTHEEYISAKAKRESDERIAKIKAEMQAQIDALKNAQSAAVQEEARKAEVARKAEEARKAKEEAERKAREEAERKAAEEARKAKESRFKFGSYPQSKVTDGNLISSLNRLVGTKPSASDAADWTDYKYYIDGEIQSFMWYKDVSYGNERYRAVYFDKWRPNGTTYKSSERNTQQKIYRYELNTIYWFKWEPIQWRILQRNSDEITLFSDMLLDSQHYYRVWNGTRTINGKTIYTNNYAQSDIRAWLNNDFYNVAFTEREKILIKTTLVDNSAATTQNYSSHYACENTFDKIYLLSYKEAWNNDYGFNSDSDRKLKTTDYAKSQGTDGDIGTWWLRSPDYNYDNRVLAVIGSGGVKDGSPSFTSPGVAPALQIFVDMKRAEEEARKAQEEAKRIAQKEAERKVKEEAERKAADEARKADEVITIIDDEHITFGRYPQSKVTDGNLISALNQFVVKTPSASNRASWTDYNYYYRKGIQRFMWYKDVCYKNERYRAVYFDKRRPYWVDYCGREGKIYQMENEYNLNTVYWFKWEPIKWKILQKNGGELTLFSDMLLDSQYYYRDWDSRTINGKEIVSSNYAYSDIRAWLNKDFYNAAFTEQEKNSIKTTLVDNSAATTLISSNGTIFACENTLDKIYLLSYKEAGETSYGFSNNDDRKRKLTDYAKVQGAYIDKDSGDIGSWWLRSACNGHSLDALCVGNEGDVNNSRVNVMSCVAPTLQIFVDLKEAARKAEESRKAEEARKALKSYSVDGNSVTFGYYPQSKVRDSKLIRALNRLEGSTPSASNSAGWTDYKYYIESEVQSFMWYKDVIYENERYRAVYFDKWRPYWTENSSSKKNTYQGDNGYKLKTIYWFKWEPIKWRIFQKRNGEVTLVSDMLLDSQHYYRDRKQKGTRTINGKTVYPNNYAQSDIRSWLNDNFYNAAFDEQEKIFIKTTLVDNSAATTEYSSNKYACENTLDKIYLLSYMEAWDKNYGFGNNYDGKHQVTDYAQIQGAYIDTDSGGMGYWWLRSPGGTYDGYALSVNYTGGLYSSYVTGTSHGVAPALRIT